MTARRCCTSSTPIPRDELFQIGEDELFETALGILHLQERQRIALFVRRDPFERFVSCLVYVPRERYDTALRQRFAAILERAFYRHASRSSTRSSTTPCWRASISSCGRHRAQLGGIDVAAIERELAGSRRAAGPTACTTR